jgi:glycosyltransferase involved in cell wall biosynthesis
MQLDIGGAETHVVDLARYLTELGYRVLVASNGGCYVERLTSFGVPHYQVPLHDSKPDLLWRSVMALRRIVRDEQVDLIHAHARIPAFVTAVMGRPKHTHFITTAHYNFKGLWYLSQWGERTIAVSEDIREYVISYFRVPRERTVVIPNGVDTELFSPAPGNPDGVAGPEREVTRIVMVSRMDGVLANVAVSLISACDQICKRWPLQLTIVGGGDNLGVVSARADDFNKSRGRTAVSMLGARTDIDHLWWWGSAEWRWRRCPVPSR